MNVLAPFRHVVKRFVPWSGLLVLAYHRIGNGDRSMFDRELWSADAETFEEQIRICKDHVDVIAASDLPDVINRKGRYALITFDDGYRDNYEVAFPILQRAGVSATFFVATGFLDHPRLPWWDELAWMVRTSRRASLDWQGAEIPFDEPDREAAVRSLLRGYKASPAGQTDEYLEAVAKAAGTGRYNQNGRHLWMTWDMVRTMQKAGMTIGGHTVTHPVLARAPLDRQQFEIRECARRIAEEVDAPVHLFSYPVGGRTSFDSVSRSCLRDAGVRYAFSYYGGIRTIEDWDDYDIRRVGMERNVTRQRFRALVRSPGV